MADAEKVEEAPRPFKVEVITDGRAHVVVTLMLRPGTSVGVDDVKVETEPLKEKAPD